MIAGNDNGIVLDDKGASSVVAPTKIDSNDLVYNTVGVLALDKVNSPIVGELVDNIIWQNHDQTAARNGTGVSSTFTNKVIVRDNMFQGNGPSDANPAGNAVNIGNGFNPAALTTTPGSLGDFIGAPAFVFPVDPRPGAAGPATFYLEANFNLTARSAAIDAAESFTATGQDFNFHNRVRVAGRGFPNLGPADDGAFEFIPTGTNNGGGGGTTSNIFVVAGSSIAAAGSAVGNGAVVYSSANLPKAITVTFSQPVNASSISSSAVTLSGSGLAAFGSARVSGVTQVNANTVKFNLTSGFSSQGQVNVDIRAGAIKSVSGVGLSAFHDFFRIAPTVTTVASTGVTAASFSASSGSTISAAPVSAGIKAASVTPTAMLSVPLTPPAVLAIPPATPSKGGALLPQGPLFKAKSLLSRLSSKKL